MRILLTVFLLLFYAQANAISLIGSGPSGVAYEYAYDGFPTLSDGSPDDGSVTFGSYGTSTVGADRVYVREVPNTSHGAGTANAINFYSFTDPADDFNNTLLCLYIGDDLAGRIDVKNDLVVDDWIGYKTLTEESAGSLEYLTTDNLYIGLCLDEIAHGNYLGRDDSIDTPANKYSTADWATNPTASITSWTSGSSGGAGLILRSWVEVIDTGGYDMTGITFWWRAESTTFDASKDYSAGDTTPQSLYGASISASAASDQDGSSYGMLADNSHEQYRFETNIANIISNVEGRVGMWVNIVSLADNFTLFYIDYDNQNRMYVMTDTANDNFIFDYEYQDTQVRHTGSADVFAEGVPFFLEIAWKISDDYKAIFIDGVESDSWTDTTLGAFTNPPIDMSFGGRIYATTDPEYYLDHFVITKDSTKSLYESRTQLNYDNSN